MRGAYRRSVPTTRSHQPKPPRDTSRTSWMAIVLVIVLAVVAAALAFYAVSSR
jgi:flagellar basal body-associated protein FliL